MQIIHPIEQLLHATALLTVTDGIETWTGTGFFCQFPLSDNRVGVCMVSCRHVLENAKKLTFSLRQQNRDGIFIEGLASISICIENGISYHPDPDIDLAAFVVHHIDKYTNSDEAKVFYLPFPLNAIPTKNQWQDVNVGDDVYVPGAPHGLQDARTGLPFMRKGSIASIPKFIETPFVYIDMPTFDGQSGSPVVIQSHVSYNLSRQHLEFRNRFFLVGVVADGVMEMDGETPVDAHFGKLVRADKILELFEQLLKDYDLHQP